MKLNGKAIPEREIKPDDKYLVATTKGDIIKTTAAQLNSSNGADITVEDGDDLVFEAGDGNGVTVSAPASPGGPVDITLPSTSGTIALTADVAAADALDEVLANGNTTGGTDINMSNGDDIVWANSGSFTATLQAPFSLPGNIIVSLPQAGGTLATTSDIDANNELSEILANGNTTTDGQTINALNGGGQLDLRYGATNNQVMLSNDSGGFGEEGFYMEDDYISYYTQGYNGYFEFDYRATTPYAQLVVEGTAIDRYLNLSVGADDISIIENTSTSVSSNSNKNHIFIGTDASSLQAGVINSVVIGGSAITGKANDTVYVPRLGFYESGTIEGYLQNGTLTADRNWTLPDFSGTVALTSDITGGFTLDDAADIALNTTTGTKIGTATSQKLGFYNATPVIQPTAMSANAGTITFVDENTPDYALSSLTTTSPAGFATLDEAQGFVEAVAAMQTRIDELETKLQALGLLA